MEIILILVLILLVCFLINQICLKCYPKISSIIRQKIHFADFFFIGLFSIEQIVFLIAYFYYQTLSSLLVGLFAVIVITTSAYQKFLMDIRLNKMTEEKGKLEQNYKFLLNKYFKYRRIKNLK